MAAASDAGTVRTVGASGLASNEVCSLSNEHIASTNTGNVCVGGRGKGAIGRVMEWGGVCGGHGRSIEVLTSSLHYLRRVPHLWVTVRAFYCYYAVGWVFVLPTWWCFWAAFMQRRRGGRRNGTWRRKRVKQEPNYQLSTQRKLQSCETQLTQQAPQRQRRYTLTQLTRCHIHKNRSTDCKYRCGTQKDN